VVHSACRACRTALQAVLLGETLLDGMQFPPCSKPSTVVIFAPSACTAEHRALI